MPINSCDKRKIFITINMNRKKAEKLAHKKIIPYKCLMRIEKAQNIGQSIDFFIISELNVFHL